MIVYRLCKKDEIDIILNDRSFHNVGKVCKINKNINTHLYINHNKYIHFFKDIDSIFYLDTTADKYICTYDIPDYLLEKYYGVGFYLDKLNFRNLEKVNEYAIENELIDFNYLLKIEKLLEYIDIEDYIYGDFSSKLEIIYLGNESFNKLSYNLEKLEKGKKLIKNDCKIYK